jgi:peroxiredoxin Q/BCP
MNIGELVKGINLSSTKHTQMNLEQFRGHWVVLYFYPKDATPGCTTEGQDFRDHHTDFLALNAVIFGVSRDSLVSHERFKINQCFPFELISDTQEQLCAQFDVIKMKSMYGKQVRGIERSTFLINPEGVLVHAWRGVRVKEHVSHVLLQLKSLQS